MRDIALIWDPANGRADFAIENGDLKMDEGLRTSLIVSLFCDRLADVSDKIPDGSGDRRGWWGDTPPAIDSNGIDLTGSKLWLLPALQADTTLRFAESYVRQAVQWMIDDGIADSVVPVATFPARGRIQISTTIRQGAASTVYDLAWGAT